MAWSPQPNPAPGWGAVVPGEHVQADRITVSGPGRLGQRGGRDQHRRRQRVAGWLPGQAAQRGPVPVGRHQGHRVGGEGDLDGAEGGQGVVAGGGDHHLADGGGELIGVGVPGRDRQLGQCRVGVYRQQVQPVAAAAAGQGQGRAVVGQAGRLARQPGADVGQQAPGCRHGARLAHLGLGAGLR